MARYYPGDHDDSVVKPLPLGVGRQNDEKAKSTSVVLARQAEGGQVGDTVKVSDDRANWLIANGIATRPQDYVDQYADERRPAEDDSEAEPEPEDPEDP